MVLTGKRHKKIKCRRHWPPDAEQASGCPGRVATAHHFPMSRYRVSRSKQHCNSGVDSIFPLPLPVSVPGDDDFLKKKYSPVVN